MDHTERTTLTDPYPARSSDQDISPEPCTLRKVGVRFSPCGVFNDVSMPDAEDFYRSNSG